MNSAEPTSPSDPATTDAAVSDAASKPGQLRRVVDNPWAVLGAIFFAMMFLGLPLLWMSRGFSLTGKVFWTIATLVYSAVVIGLFCLVMWYSYRSIADSLGY